MLEDAHSSPEDHVRGAAEIARRALTLFGAIGISFGPPRRDIVTWLKEEGLWDELSPSELAYVSTELPTKKQKIDTSWKSEGLIVLLWVLEKVERLPLRMSNVTHLCFNSIYRPSLT